MSYTKQTWANGDIITAAKLNHMEDGIAGVEADVSSLDTKLLASLPHDTASGSIASFPDGAAMPVRDLSVNIEPVQAGSGDPAPDNVRPISGWTEAKVTRTGKNILDASIWASAITGASFENDTLSCTAINQFYSIPYVFSKEDVEATFSFDSYSGTATNIRAELLSSDNTVVGTLNLSSNTQITATASKIRLNYSSAGSVSIVKPQIEIGSAATAYEAYQGQTYTIDLDGTRYGGTLDVTSGKLTVDMKMVDMGSLEYVYNPTVPNYPFFAAALLDMASGTDNYVSSNYANSGQHATISSVPDMACMTIGQQFRVRDSRYDNAAALKAAVSGAQLCYELATPQTIQLTPTQVELLLGENNIWSDAGDITADYYADPTLYINKKLAAAIAALS